MSCGTGYRWARSRAWATGLAVLGGTLVPLAGAAPAAAQTHVHAYVADVIADAVLVFDTATNTRVGGPVSVGDAPVDVALTPDGTRAFVTNNASKTVSVIDTTTNTVVGGAVSVGSMPAGVAVSPDGTRVYVVNTGSNSVSVIGNTATPTVIATVPVGNSPQDVALSPDGTRAFVTNTGSDNVTVIDNTATPPTPLGAPLAVGDAPWGVTTAATPLSTTNLYVANSGAGTVSVIDTVLGTVHTVPVGSQPRALAVAPIALGNRVYVGNFGTDTVSVIETTGTNPPAAYATLTVGAQPQGVAVTPDGARIYVTNTAAGSMSVIDNTVTPPAVLAPPVGGLGTPVGLAIGTVPAPPQPQIPTTLTLEAKKKGKQGHGPGVLGSPDGKGPLVLKATLTAGSEPVEGRTVRFTRGSTTLCTEVTDDQGRAACEVRGKPADKACYAAAFAGDATYGPSTATLCRRGARDEPRSGRPVAASVPDLTRTATP